MELKIINKTIEKLFLSEILVDTKTKICNSIRNSVEIHNLVTD